MWELVKCSECRKLHVIYTKKKLMNANMAIKHIFNNFQYVCGAIFHNVPIDERNRDTLILELLHCWENLTCTSPIEIPYYSCKIFLKICYHCGSNKRLLPSDPVFYPQCDHFQLKKERQKIAKWKQVVSSDLGKSKKQKTIVWLNFFTKYFWVFVTLFFLYLHDKVTVKEKFVYVSQTSFCYFFLISKAVFFQNHWVFLISKMRWQAVFIIRQWAWGPGS